MENQEREGLDSPNSPSTSGTASSSSERRPTHGSNVSLNGALNGGSRGSNVPLYGALNSGARRSNVPLNGALNGGARGSNVPLNGALSSGARGSNVPLNGALNGSARGSNVPLNGALNGGARGSNVPLNGALSGGARGSNVPLNGALNGGARGSNVPLNGALNGGACGNNVPLNGALNGDIRGTNVSLNGGARESSFSNEDIWSQDKQTLESAFRNWSLTDCNRALPSSSSPARHHDKLLLNGNGHIKDLEEPEEMFETYHQRPNAVMPTNTAERSPYRKQTQNDYVRSLQNHGNELQPRTSTWPLIQTSDPSDTLRGSQDPNWNYAATNSHFHNFYLNYAAVNSNYNYNNQLGTDLMNNNPYGYYDQGLCCEAEGFSIHHGENAAYPHVAATIWSNGLTNVVPRIGRADEGDCSSSCHASCLPSHCRYPSGSNYGHDLRPYQEQNSVESMWFPPFSNPGHDQDFNSAESFQLPPVNGRYSLRPQQEYNSVDEIAGRIYYLAKNHEGCRFLRMMLTEGTAEDVHKVFNGLANHFTELSSHPLGSCLIQNLLEVCSTNQRMFICYQLTRSPGKLVRISCDMHGTRVVQKVIEGIKSSDESLWAVSALRPHATTLMKDENGSHVVEQCFQHLLPEHRQLLIDVALAHYVELAMDRRGCCMLQACINHSTGLQKDNLMKAIASMALTLSDDTYGNYVVQFVLEHGTPSSRRLILNSLRGHHVTLSMQKYASNVVEKCLVYGGPDNYGEIVQELIRNPRFSLIAEDQYGNYVVQTALAESKGPLRAALVNAIRRHAAVLRTNLHGKKVLSAAGLKSK
ncbi:uncharacterized protein LOC109718121 [Ananas comosus]|uniref:Uncharacterized protein LOC109718121 n=1 Tax=Ananas comosus TaxID=4615 RepID=A0A6P5FVN9_ANACO|nr:uncharacterized protein LOC109718121 [Ananas comosus]